MPVSGYICSIVVCNVYMYGFFTQNICTVSFLSVDICHNELPDFQGLRFASWLGQVMKGYIIFLFSAYFFYIFTTIASTSRDPQEPQDDGTDISWADRDFHVALADFSKISINIIQNHELLKDSCCTTFITRVLYPHCEIIKGGISYD